MMSTTSSPDLSHMNNISQTGLSTLIDLENYECSDLGLLLPLVSEATHSRALRASVYGIMLLWCLLAFMLLVDQLSCAIETIADKTRTILVASDDSPTGYEEVQIKLWNETVISVTLLAFGPKAPEILLNVLDTLLNGMRAEELGHMTVLGSAIFNMLFVSGICIVAVPTPQTRRIKQMQVFGVILVFGVLPYIWLWVVLMLVSPDYVELWEAVVTFAWFPVFVALAFLADKRFCCGGSVHSHTGQSKDSGYMKVQMGFDGSSGSYKTKQQYVNKEETREIFTDLTQKCGNCKDMDIQDTAQMVAKRVTRQRPHHNLWYRITTTRRITGGRRLEPILSKQARHNYKQTFGKPKESVAPLHSKGIIGDITTQSLLAVIEFTSSACSVFEKDGKVVIGIQRIGRLKNFVTCWVETFDGSASAHKDYIPIQQEVMFKPQETFKTVTIQIVDDLQWEPDEVFFVRLSVPPGQEGVAGKQSINRVTIMDDDEPGELEFEKPSYVVKESVGTTTIPLQRHRGADGVVKAFWQTKDMTAKQGVDFKEKDGVVVFEHGETEKSLELTVIDGLDEEKVSKCFQIEISGTEGGARIGRRSRTVVTLVSDEEYGAMLTRLVDMANMKIESLQVSTTTWRQQLRDAINVNGGDVEEASVADYFFHLVAFGWKVIFAFIPPPSIWGGWPSFFISLAAICFIATIVSDLARIFGCLVGLKDSVTAITILVIGVGLPDVFASRKAAVQEKFADGTMGSLIVTNSVNVFLGLGVPWVIAAGYWTTQGLTFEVPARKLGFSITYYIGAAGLCVLLLLARRYFKLFGCAELGGPRALKILSLMVLFCLWLSYTVLSVLQAYGVLSSEV